MFEIDSKPQRVAVYCRVSTEDQAERDTIQNQVQVAKAICPALGMEIVDFYLDDGVSGTIPFAARPAGAQLLADAKRGLFQQVVAYRLDRVGRTAMVILTAHDTFKSLGVALKSLTEPFDTSSPFGEFVMGILAMVAGYERESIISRTTLGRRRKAREGKWTGGRAALGYHVTEDGNLEIEEEEAVLVRRIFDWYVNEHLSGMQIATRLNAMGELTQSARRGFTTKRIKQLNHWDHTRVLHILQNESYIGQRRVGKQSKSGEIITQDVPVIVPVELFEQAQRLRGENWKYASRNAKREYLMRGLMFCTQCGRRYVGYTTNHTSGKAGYYKCGRHECGSPNLRAELIENIVWDDIKRFVANPGDVLLKLQAQVQELAPNGVEQELGGVDRAIARIEEERQRIIYLHRKGMISQVEGEAQLVATGHEKSQLLAHRESLQAISQQKEGQRQRLSGAEALLMELQKRAEEADEKTKREVIALLVNRVDITRTEDGKPAVSIVYTFEPAKGEGEQTLIADISSTRRIK